MKAAAEVGGHHLKEARMKELVELQMVKGVRLAAAERSAESEAEVGEEVQKVQVDHLKSSEEEVVELPSLEEERDYELCLSAAHEVAAQEPKHDLAVAEDPGMPGFLEMAEGLQIYGAIQYLLRWAF